MERPAGRPARFTERKVVAFSPEQMEFLRAEADRRGVSESQVVREAVDAMRRKR